MPRSKGPATAGVIATSAERGALVGAGQVGVARGVVGGWAGAGGGVDRADFEAAGQLGSACSRAPCWGLRACAAWRSRPRAACATPGQLGRQPRRQGGFEAAPGAGCRLRG